MIVRTLTELTIALDMLDQIENPTEHNKNDMRLIKSAINNGRLDQSDVDNCETGCAKWIMDIDESGYWVFWELRGKRD
jgi:hypothetical protein